MATKFRRTSHIITILSILSISGCNEQISYFPLKSGNRWDYHIRNGLQTRVDTLKVKQNTPVASCKGYQLLSHSGTLELAWKGTTLYLAKTPNIRFIPSLTWLDVSTTHCQNTWKGTVRYLGNLYSTEINITQSEDMILFKGSNVKTLKVILTTLIEGKNIELITWFSQNLGIIQQQQRTNGTLNISQEYLNGPY